MSDAVPQETPRARVIEWMARHRVPIWVAVGVACVIAGLCVRSISDGRAEIVLSESARARQDVEAAIVHARRAAACYVPFAEHVPLAYASLANIAQQAEARGDYETALFAWRSVRAAGISSRSVLPIAQPWRARADRAITQLLVAGVEARDRGHGRTAQPSAAELARLQSEPPPRRGPLAARAGSAVCLIGCAWWALRAGVVNGRFERGRARRSLIPLAIAVVAWVVAFWLG